jgi:putative DNA-invertase from lambdoid prophage Rac
MAAAEFERELIRERSMAGLKRYRGQYAAGRVGKEVHSRSGKDLPVGRPKRIFARQQVLELRARRVSAIARLPLALELGKGP